MVDKEKLSKNIRELENYLKQLGELQQVDKDKFINDWRTYYQMDRCLHLSLETFLSLGEMIISEFKFKKPDSYGDIPKILLQNNVVSQELADKLIDLSKFRNVLVHDYLHLDHERVYEHLMNAPLVIGEFLNCIKEFIKKKEA